MFRVRSTHVQHKSMARQRRPSAHNGWLIDFTSEFRYVLMYTFGTAVLVEVYSQSTIEEAKMQESTGWDERGSAGLRGEIEP